MEKSLMPLLNLTDNEQMDFDAIPSGKYWAEVFDAEERETKGGEGAKLPKGTPMIWLHFKILGKVGEDDGPNEDSDYYNRRVFRTLVIPPAKIGGKAYEHYKKMNGQIVRCLVALGYTEEEVTAGDFELDVDDLIERQAVLSVKKKLRKGTGGETGEPEEWDNEVAGFRNVNDVQASSSSSGLL
jgi:hypothetical protein